MAELTPWQRKIARNYAGGEYNHLKTLDECRDVGDGLFTFLMIELDPSEGCNNSREAIERLQVAASQLENLVHTI